MILHGLGALAMYAMPSNFEGRLWGQTISKFLIYFLQQDTGTSARYLNERSAGDHQCGGCLGRPHASLMFVLKNGLMGW